MMDTYHDNDIDDCGTKHFIKYKVDNEDKLRLINGRHYYKINENGNKICDDLFTVDKDRDKSLIGTTIGLRSPVTCAGKHICATCYGKVLSEKNRNLNTGLVAVLRLTEPLTQTLLSAKHCTTCC